MFINWLWIRKTRALTLDAHAYIYVAPCFMLHASCLEDRQNSYWRYRKCKCSLSMKPFLVCYIIPIAIMRCLDDYLQVIGLSQIKYVSCHDISLGVGTIWWLHICATIYHFHDLFRIYVPLFCIHYFTLFCPFFSKGGYFTVLDSFTSPQDVVKLVS